MKIIPVNSTLVISLAILFVITTVTISRSQTSEVETILKREMKERGIPGLQIAVVQHGKIVLLKSYGVANLQDSVAVNNHSIFAINSCTKAFTGVAIMQLVEGGKIDLAAPVSKYLDGLPTDWQPVTIKQLLTHISGLPDIINIVSPSTHGLGDLGTEAAAWEKVKTMPMQFKTGEQFSYNQTNYALLAKVIDKVSGKPFAQMFKERQFQAVNMSNTLYGDSRDVIPHFAPTYTYRNNIDGQALNERKLINNYSEFPAFLRSGSGLNSTAEDMANWIITLQQGKLLKLKTLNTLWQAGSYNNGLPTQWALGWGFTKFRKKHKAVGMTGGGRSGFLVYPDDDLAIVVLTNLIGGTPEDFIEELATCYNADIAAYDPMTLLRIQLRKQGFEKAIEIVNEEKKKNAEFQPDENDLNDWGYRLMSKGQDKEAREIFKLNINLYPKSWNTYDSYGEALLKNGQKEEAIKMYSKSVDLNPDNQNGKEVLKRILK
jgi:CubicO group peptidase (beta-lactamase class C family)